MTAKKIFFSGPLKNRGSLVAKLIGERLRLPVIEIDARVSEKAGLALAELLEGRHESLYRALESEAVNELINDNGPCVAVLGAETAADRVTRRALLRSGILITLNASVEELERDLAPFEKTRLIRGCYGGSNLNDWALEQAPAYAECHAFIELSNKSLESLANEAEQVVKDAPVVVPLGERTYRVQIGSGIRLRLPRLARQVCSGEAAALLVTDTGAEKPWAEEMQRSLINEGNKVVFFSMPAGESAKQLDTVASIWRTALDSGMDRGSIVIGVGGGVVGDISGFIAATLFRGVALGHVPTTLLAMVDSSIGGKTGFDTTQGKNLIGAFYQPRFILADTDTLRGLPFAELRAGLAEVVKSAWLDGERSVAGL